MTQPNRIHTYTINQIQEIVKDKTEGITDLDVVASYPDHSIIEAIYNDTKIKLKLYHDTNTLVLLKYAYNIENLIDA